MHVKARLPAAYYLTVAQKKGQEAPGRGEGRA